VRTMKLVVALVPFAAVAAACAPAAKTGTTTASAAVSVDLARATLGPVPAYFEAGGVVRARLTASISSRVLAPVLEVAVSPGDRVRRGQVLVRLDARELDANRQRAAAALAAAEQAVTAAGAGRDMAQASLDLAQATYARIEALRDRRSATPQEFDRAAADRRSAEAQVAAAGARAAEAFAALEASRAAADAALVTASYAELTAPFDGVVASRTIDPGSVASPGVPLLVVEDAGSPRLEVRVDEARAGVVSEGGEAQVRFDRDDGGDEGWTPERVVEVERIDPASHSFLVKVDLAGSPRVPSGSFGRARFAGPSRSVLTAPVSTLVRRGQLAFVFVVDGGVARLQPVDAGPIVDGRVELLAGAHDGDALVASPPPSLTDGARVRENRPSPQGGTR
jgi:membrane fusion protein, multidrug efflux system